MNYILTLTAFFSIGIILAMSLNLVMGYAGRVSMAHGGLMGVGAYTAGWVALNLGVSLVWAMLIAAAVAALVGWLFGLATVRIGGDDFILASFALQMVIVEAVSRWTDVTRGTYGMSGIPRPDLFGITISSVPALAAYAFVIMVICAILLIRISGSTFGLVLRGVRESEASMAALGTDTARIKIAVMVIASAFAGVAGTILVAIVSYLHPDNFSVMLSIIIVAYVVVGGLGNMWGAALGAVLLLSVPEIITATDLVPSHLLGPMERIVYGLILMLFVWFRPKGIVPERPVLNVGRLLRSGRITPPSTQHEHATVEGSLR